VKGSRNAVRKVGERSGNIRATFPASVSPEAQKQFMRDALKAVELYVAWLPLTDDESSIEVLGRAAHRPADPHRHTLMTDLFDAYMTARGDDLQARGFQKTANAVLAAAGCDFIVTDHDLTTIRAQREAIAPYAERLAIKDILRIARGIGPATTKMIRAQIRRPKHKRREEALRSAARILCLAENFSAERLEQMCQRALVLKVYSYSDLRTLLETPAAPT